MKDKFSDQPSSLEILSLLNYQPISIREQLDAILIKFQEDLEKALRFDIPKLPKALEFYEDKVKTFSKARWNIAPSMPQALIEEVFDAKLGNKPHHINEIIRSFYHDNDYTNLQKMVLKWYENPFFEKRRQILQDALEAHINQKYTLSIPALLPIIEGVLTEYTQEYQISVTPGKTTKIYKSILGNPDSDDYDCRIDRWPILQTLFDTLKNHIYAPSDFENEMNKPVGRQHLSRHTVLHGIAINYPTVYNSLKIFLVLDSVAELFHYIEEYNNS